MPQSYLFMRVPKDFITQNDHLALIHNIDLIQRNFSPEFLNKK